MPEKEQVVFVKRSGLPHLTSFVNALASFAQGEEGVLTLSLQQPLPSGAMSVRITVTSVKITPERNKVTFFGFMPDVLHKHGDPMPVAGFAEWDQGKPVGAVISFLVELEA